MKRRKRSPAKSKIVWCSACGRRFVSLPNSGVPGCTWDWFCPYCNYNNSPGGRSQLVHRGMDWREMRRIDCEDEMEG